MAKVSLCVIAGNEENYIERFLNSFGPAFDELCLVRAIGNQPHDKTLMLAKAWCEKNGKACHLGEYRNEGWHGNDFAAAVDDLQPGTWRHVDSFAAARNQSWLMATGDYQLWADLDDILVPGSADQIRMHAGEGKFDQFYFRYSIPAQNEGNFRERMFKTGISQWGGPVHENCHLQFSRFPGRKFESCNDEHVVYSHEPDDKKNRDPRRNLRIVNYTLRHLPSYAYEMHREHFYLWGQHKKEEDREAATKWAEIAQHTGTHGELRMQILINQTCLVEDTDIDHALDLAYSAIRICPLRRETWGRLAELQLKAGMPVKARESTSLMRSMPKPLASGWPRSERYHGWEGVTLRTRAVRATGDEALARKEEDAAFKANGARFSLLHATRGRPEQALATRAHFLMAAINPLGVEHIFAIDEDDKESLERLKEYRHVVVKEPRGCVKAWNAAAADSTGAVLVQLSDDWLPCIHWDELCWLALQEAANAKKGTEKQTFYISENTLAPYHGEHVPVANVPLVLAISDGHRTDDLLCMAICTRARYDGQEIIHQVAHGDSYTLNHSYLFHPDYFGVFSDNEFSVRAFDDGVVVKAKHICFEHRHPIFEGKKWEEMDSTYQRQNAAERYREGAEIFNRRNPKYATK